MRSRLALGAALLMTLFPAAAAWADAGPALSVDASAGRHAISPLIYGWNFADPGFAAQVDLPVDRRGGNAADTLNWQTGVENHSNDFFFENLPTCWASCPDGWDPAHSYTDQIEGDRTVGAKSLIDLPMLGILPTDMGDNNAVYCSYSVAKYGDQDHVDGYDTDCGDGLQGGVPVANDPSDTGTAQPASFQGSWIDDLVSRYGTAANGGVAFYELGNEPALWNSTHRDWHPDPVSADELWNKSFNLAQQVKQHDPSADVIGPAEWGWPNYFCSAADGGCGPSGPSPVAGTDFEKYGPVLEWYLKQFHDAEQNNGVRYLDYLDVHYYAQGGSTTDITRSLWDPTYTDPSWIGDQIQLIPRMRQWVADDYPGTKLSLSEYDLANGGDATANNLIEADVLGIFAREQMDMATLWPEVSNDNYYDAFRIFRNYDGAHSKFGDEYVASTSANQSALAVYGAVRGSDGALTVVVINKGGTDLTSTLGLAGFTPAANAQVWRWAGAGGGIARQADQPMTTTGFSATFPARSITMVAIPKPGAGQPPAPVGEPAGGTTPGTTGTTGGTGGTGTTAKKCVVPKLRGLKLKKAKVKLKKAHCRLGKVAHKKSSKRKGTVIAQTPKPRKKLKSGAKIRVTLSRGR